MSFSQYFQLCCCRPSVAPRMQPPFLPHGLPLWPPLTARPWLRLGLGLGLLLLYAIAAIHQFNKQAKLLQPTHLQAIGEGKKGSHLLGNHQLISYFNAQKLRLPLPQLCSFAAVGDIKLAPTPCFLLLFRMPVCNSCGSMCKFNQSAYSTLVQCSSSSSSRTLLRSFLALCLRLLLRLYWFTYVECGKISKLN